MLQSKPSAAHSWKKLAIKKIKITKPKNQKNPTKEFGWILLGFHSLQEEQRRISHGEAGCKLMEFLVLEVGLLGSSKLVYSSPELQYSCPVQVTLVLFPAHLKRA
jgi:hypothetical protein